MEISDKIWRLSSITPLYGYWINLSIWQKLAYFFRSGKWPRAIYRPGLLDKPSENPPERRPPTKMWYTDHERNVAE